MVMTQIINKEKAVNRFAEIFWETKGVETKRVVSPYEPKEKIVYPVL